MRIADVQTPHSGYSEAGRWLQTIGAQPYAIIAAESG